MNFNGCDVSCGTAYGAVVIGVRVAEGCANSMFFTFVLFNVTHKCAIGHCSVRRFFFVVDEEVSVRSVD